MCLGQWNSCCIRESKSNLFTSSAPSVAAEHEELEEVMCITEPCVVQVAVEPVDEKFKPCSPDSLARRTACWQ